jgi:hypothetical protein
VRTERKERETRVPCPWGHLEGHIAMSKRESDASSGGLGYAIRTRMARVGLADGVDGEGADGGNGGGICGVGGEGGHGGLGRKRREGRVIG